MQLSAMPAFAPLPAAPRVWRRLQQGRAGTSDFTALRKLVAVAAHALQDAHTRPVTETLLQVCCQDCSCNDALRVDSQDFALPVLHKLCQRNRLQNGAACFTVLSVTSPPAHCTSACLFTKPHATHHVQASAVVCRFLRCAAAAGRKTHTHSRAPAQALHLHWGSCCRSQNQQLTHSSVWWRTAAIGKRLWMMHRVAMASRALTKMLWVCCPALLQGALKTQHQGAAAAPPRMALPLHRAVSSCLSH